MVISIIWIAFILLQQKKKSESHKKVCEKKELFNVIIPSEDTKTLKLNQYQKSDKASFVIFVDRE